MIESDFEGFRYHKPLPDFYKTDNPQNPKSRISDKLIKQLNELAFKHDFTSISYSRLNDELKKEFSIDFDNVIIFKFLIGDDLIKMNPSPDKCRLMDEEFQNYGFHIYEFADFLRKNGFQADLIHPLDDNISLRAIALLSNECVITRSNMCYFKDGLNSSFFMIHTSIDNLPVKMENEMLWVKDFCSTCGVCIERCPHNAFDKSEKLSRKLCTAHREGCNECILKCPYYRRGYDKVKKRHDKMKR